MNQQAEPVVVVTGGTGSFGSAFARFLLRETRARVRLISRGEHAQSVLKQEIGCERATFIIGDVRNLSRMRVAFEGADMVVHAAALKLVPGSEVHGWEYTLTNVLGTMNVLDAAVQAGVKRSLFISTDKAVDPFNPYGKMKAVAETLFIQHNEYGRQHDLKFAAVRGGNVWGSAGSVVVEWKKQIAEHLTPIVHDPTVTRFHLDMNHWVHYCWRVAQEMHGGEIFTPILEAWQLGDLAEALGSAYTLNGRRAGDKHAEVLISPHEVDRARDIGWSYVVEPSETLRSVMHYEPWAGAPLPDGFVYSSDSVGRISIEELRQWLLR